MAKQPPSIIGDLDLSPAAKRAAADVQHTNVYIPRLASECIREIAFNERKKIHDLIMGGVYLAIAGG
jgi:hypothetical protein